MLRQDLRLRATGGDVRTGRLEVAERPAACRRRDAAADTHNDPVEGGGWVVRGRWRRADATCEERHSLLVGVGVSASDTTSSAIDVIDPHCRRLVSNLYRIHHASPLAPEVKVIMTLI